MLASQRRPRHLTCPISFLVALALCHRSGLERKKRWRGRHVCLPPKMGLRQSPAFGVLYCLLLGIPFGQLIPWAWEEV